MKFTQSTSFRRISLLTLLLLSFLLNLNALPLLEITSENVDKVVGRENYVVILFTKVDCSHCKTMEPEFEAAADVITKYDGITLGTIDHDASPDLFDRFGVTQEPVFKFFRPASIDPEKFLLVHYEGRIADTLLGMISERVDGFFRKSKPILNFAIDLTSKTFDATLLEGNHMLVLFYTKWAERTSVKEAVRQLSVAFQDEPVTIAKLAVETVHERDIMQRYGVKDFPTFVYFSPMGKEWEKLEVDVYRDFHVNTYLGYLNKKASTFRTIAGGLGAGSGKVKEMEKFAITEITPESVLEAKMVAEGLVGTSRQHAEHYIKTMERFLEKGPEYVRQEIKRLKTLLERDTISASKRNLFAVRKDVLESFLPLVRRHEEL